MSDMQEYSTEQLLSRKKLLKTVQYIIGGVILVYAGLMIFFIAQSDWNANNPMQSMPFILMMISIIITNSSLKKINEELEKR